MLMMDDLIHAYKQIKLKGDEEKLKFLYHIARYCQSLDFSYCETILMLGMVRSCFPYGDLTWATVEDLDEFDEKFNKDLRDKWDLTKIH